MTNDIAFLTACELVEKYRNGDVSPVEAIEDALARIDRLEPALNAFQLVDANGARRSAHAAEDRWRRGVPVGVLDGVPVTIKDIVLTKGWPTLSGSLAIDPAQAWTEDAPAVARLREAGAILLGKTTTPEFGWKGMTDSPLRGITRNPWNLDHTPGGSSGGAAAALAAGIGALAHGTDGGGSIRIPASYCGLFGFKPTYGRVPHYPQSSPLVTLMTSGPIARSVGDAALMLTEIAKPDPRDGTALPHDGRDYRQGLEDGVKGLRVAFSPALGGAEPRAEVLKIVVAGVQTLREAGAKTSEVGGIIEPLRPVFEDYWLAGFAHTLRQIAPEKRELLDPRFRALAERGLAVGLESYYAAIVARARLAGQFETFLQDYDLLVTPTMPSTAPPVTTLYHSVGFDRWRDAVPYTLPFNLTGHPAASIPCGITTGGLPVGLQIVGRRGTDALVLRASRAFERATGWSVPYPVLSASLERLGA